MQTVTQSPTARKAFYASLADTHGVAFSTNGRYFFVSDANEWTELTSTDGLTLLGRIDLAEAQHLDDLLRGGPAAIACTRTGRS